MSDTEKDIPVFTYRRLISLHIEDESDNKNNKICGFHLTRSPWDPYPWISYVEPGSIADKSGLKAGDCLLDINATDIVGLRVKEIASLIKREPGVTIDLQVWRHDGDENQDTSEFGVAVSGPLPSLARKLAKAVSGTICALECPICLETASSPVSQCVHGHILCSNCRKKTPRCPICRIRLGQGRCLLADQIQINIRDAYQEDFSRLVSQASANGQILSSALREKLFGKSVGKNTADKKENAILPAVQIKRRLGRFLLGGFDKAASVDNLTNEPSSSSATASPLPCYRRLGELFTGDRAKSASTGELREARDHSPANKTQPNGSELEGTRNFYNNSSGYLSVPVPSTPCWGGSMESVVNSFPCPLGYKTSCYEPVHNENLIEHFGKNHQIVQIHFYGSKITIPIKMDFNCDTIHVIHYANDLFFFHFEQETAWMTSPSTKGEWILHGKSSENTEIKLKRRITKIDNVKPVADLAPIPKAFNIMVLDIELLVSQSEGLDI
ncbi:uncharacterized protein LOC130669585 isoform X2 [Microplitis mediator]|uniref:uncharacterized protein LOC130669585 isoform X2 n=1 Tax=Microplitis mediator TaxID=375433 RepID=UPI002553C135|nr:uncharacterized protein LOC130669585 isoform X2 [Microplitis mediator]